MNKCCLRARLISTILYYLRDIFRLTLILIYIVNVYMFPLFCFVFVHVYACMFVLFCCCVQGMATNTMQPCRSRPSADQIWNRCHRCQLLLILLNHYSIWCLKSPFLPEASFGLRVLSLSASVCVCVRPCVNHELVRVITHHPFLLGSPNLDQRCKRPWLRSLLFCGAIDRELQGQIELQNQNLPHFELVHAITHHQLKLQLLNLEQKCILALFRSLPILGLIEIGLKFNF